MRGIRAAEEAEREAVAREQLERMVKIRSQRDAVVARDDDLVAKRSQMARLLEDYVAGASERAAALGALTQELAKLPFEVGAEDSFSFSRDASSTQREAICLLASRASCESQSATTTRV